jgi:hypothetical protein
MNIINYRHIIGDGFDTLITEFKKSIEAGIIKSSIGASSTMYNFKMAAIRIRSSLKLNELFTDYLKLPNL